MRSAVLSSVPSETFPIEIVEIFAITFFAFVMIIALLKLKERGPLAVRLWPTRLVYILSVISGIVLLIVDSPPFAEMHFPINHSVIEAVPLLLVGVALLAWLAIDRPGLIDLIKQGFITVAFILWGVDLLIPPGPWATFIGAVVIAIYVFDLAWVLEGNVRKKFDEQRGNRRRGDGI